MVTDMVFSNLAMFYTALYAFYGIFAAMIVTFAKNKSNAAVLNLVLSTALAACIGILTAYFELPARKSIFIIGLLGVAIVRDLIALVLPKGNYSAVVIVLTICAGILLYNLSDSLKYMVFLLPMWIEIMVYDVSDIKDMPVLMSGWSFFALIELAVLRLAYPAVITIMIFIISMIGYFKYYKMSAFDTLNERNKDKQKRKIEKAIKGRDANRAKIVSQLDRFT